MSFWLFAGDLWLELLESLFSLCSKQQLPTFSTGFRSEPIRWCAQTKNIWPSLLSSCAPKPPHLFFPLKPWIRTHHLHQVFPYCGVTLLNYSGFVQNWSKTLLSHPAVLLTYSFIKIQWTCPDFCFLEFCTKGIILVPQGTELDFANLHTSASEISYKQINLIIFPPVSWTFYIVFLIAIQKNCVWEVILRS